MKMVVWLALDKQEQRQALYGQQPGYCAKADCRKETKPLSEGTVDFFT